MTERSQLQPVKLDDKTEVFFEIAQTSGREKVGVLDGLPIANVTEIITDLGQNLTSALRSAGPQKYKVELGMEFSVKNGKLIAIVAQGSAKANFKITLEWDSAKS